LSARPTLPFFGGGGTFLMEDLENKLGVLADIARVLNGEHLVWAVGASLLLYLHRKTDRFCDIDLMVTTEDALRLKAALEPMGTLAPPRRSEQYRSRYFWEFTIGGVDVDVMAGLAIVQDGVVHECPFSAAQVTDFALVRGERIPLQSLADWRRYYALMGRTAKVQMIDT
jgi:hypothetical protein